MPFTLRPYRRFLVQCSVDRLGKGLPMRLATTFGLFVFLLFAFIGVCSAGEKGKLVSLLVDYADLKQRVLEVRETRKSGYASEPKSLLALGKEIQQATLDTMKFRISELTPGTKDKNQETTTNMIYAYNAMGQLIQAELDRYSQFSNVGLQLAEKYEEIWKFVDPSIPVVSAP